MHANSRRSYAKGSAAAGAAVVAAARGHPRVLAALLDAVGGCVCVGGAGEGAGGEGTSRSHPSARERAFAPTLEAAAIKT